MIKKIKNVLLAARWGLTPASNTFKADLLATVRVLMDSGARVYILKDVPLQSFSAPKTVALTAYFNGDIEQLGVTREKHQKIDRELADTFEKAMEMGATVLDPSRYFLNSKNLYGVVLNDRILYTDDNHLTLDGARLLVPLFEPIFLTK